MKLVENFSEMPFISFRKFTFIFESFATKKSVTFVHVPSLYPLRSRDPPSIDSVMDHVR